VGLALGSLVGLLGGPVGLAVGALTGTLVGAMRDIWVAGVDIDFIAQAQARLQTGKVALVAEIEEEWVVPVDTALEAVGGQVLRRSRNVLPTRRSTRTWRRSAPTSPRWRPRWPRPAARRKTGPGLGADQGSADTVTTHR
jgi:hypothetical protein